MRDIRRRDGRILTYALDGHAALQTALRANASGDELGARRGMKVANSAFRAICIEVEGETKAA